jgi:hypothetical protein
MLPHSLLTTIHGHRKIAIPQMSTLCVAQMHDLYLLLRRHTTAFTKRHLCLLTNVATSGPSSREYWLKSTMRKSAHVVLLAAPRGANPERGLDVFGLLAGFLSPCGCEQGLYTGQERLHGEGLLQKHITFSAQQ